ncbi:MAG TPA: hypothetical protein VH599_07760 [Ktedonobacterales bacterium]|jgi:hypothetical protein
MSNLHHHFSMRSFVIRSFSPLSKPGWKAILLLLLCGLLTLGTSQSATAAAASIPYMHPFFARFTPSVTYEQALRLVTDLGLQPAFDCAIWQPMGQQDAFAKEHRLLIAPAYLMAPDDWFVRLQQTAGVETVVEGFPTIAGYTPPTSVPADAVYTCPSQGTAPLNSGEAGTFAQISFASPQTTYDQALFDVSDIGPQLADPCYEQSQLQRFSLPWHPMGQADRFAQSSTLIVQTNKQVTSAQWRYQLRALPNVIAVETLAPPSWCWTPILIALVAFGALSIAVLVAVFWVVWRRRSRRRGGISDPAAG